MSNHAGQDDAPIYTETVDAQGFDPAAPQLPPQPAALPGQQEAQPASLLGPTTDRKPLAPTDG